MLLSVAAIALHLPAEWAQAAEPARIRTDLATYVFSPDDGVLSVELEGRRVRLLRGVGPAWESDGERRSALQGDVRVTEAQVKGDAGRYV
jgi:hypothetical protein